MRSKSIEQHKKTLKLTKRQRETLVGLLLGDACLESNNQGRTYRLKIEQSAQHEPYVRHLYELFADWVLSPPRKRTATASTGAETTSWTFNTVSHGAFRFYAQQYYLTENKGGDAKERRKCVPKLIHRWLTPRGLAYWFMDNGSIKSRQSKGVIFNTQCFPKREIERLINVLLAHFELEAKIRRQKEGNQIYVSGKSYERFVKLVDPFLVEEMRYKLPQPRRTDLPKE